MPIDIVIQHQFSFLQWCDMIEDENYYIYAEEVWLDELKMACGQKPVGKLREKCTSSELQVIEQKNNDWKELFSSCLGKMTAIQLACDQYVVKNQNWNVQLLRIL